MGARCGRARGPGGAQRAVGSSGDFTLNPWPIHRRRVVAAAAWATPAVALGAAAPALAVTGECVPVYPFTLSAVTAQGYYAEWTNDTTASITLVFTTTVPSTSVASTQVAQTPSGGNMSANVFNPTSATSFAFPGGGSMSSTAAVVSGGSRSWVTTVVVPANTKLGLETLATSCRGSGLLATVVISSPTLDCPFTYPVHCPF